jgi:cytochrome c oxidase subunit 1
MGIPRRTWETSVLNVPHKETLQMLLGIGAIIAFTGLIIFVLHTVLTLLFGKKLQGSAKPTFPQVAEPATSKAPISGTLVLALIFFAYLVVMFSLNWYWLSKVWEVR